MRHPNWYLYYRLLHAVPSNNQMRRSIIQDVLMDLRSEAEREWPGATAQKIQDFYEYLARTSVQPFSEAQARHLTLMEPWACEEVTNV